jgi:hypothetical protein
MPVAAGRILALAVAVTCIAAGGALLAGLYAPAAPAPLRIGFGSVLVLLGINRYVMSRLKVRPSRRRQLHDDTDS